MSRETSPQTVWVLSEEAPFVDPEESGGLVCGVFATPTAALYYLAAFEIGPEGLAEITWTPCGARGYDGLGYGENIYILRSYAVENDVQLRAAQHGWVSDLTSLSPQALAACLPPWEEDPDDEP